MIYKNAVGGDHQAPTFIVAASDSLHPERADYVCNGTADQVEIQAAIDESAIGSKISMNGTFSISAPIVMEDKALTLDGGGHAWSDGGTRIYLANGSDCDMIQILATNGEHSFFPTLRNMYLNGNYANQTGSGNGVNIYRTGTGIVSDLKIIDVGIEHCIGHGVYGGIGWLNTLTRVWSEYNRGSGFWFQDGHPKFIQCHSSFNETFGGVIISHDAQIVCSSFTQNVQNGIYLQGDQAVVTGCRISNNGFGTVGQYSGIIVLLGNNTVIGNNIFDGENTEKNGVEVIDSTSNTLISNNLFLAHTATPIWWNSPTNLVARNNVGFVTENSGTATLVSGTTSIAVTHGLAVTPTAGDIVVTPIEAWGSMTEFYIDTYTSTQFTIHADQNPTQDVDFAWKAARL